MTQSKGVDLPTFGIIYKKMPKLIKMNHYYSGLLCGIKIETEAITVSMLI
jgi:hypothetical protein